MPDFGRSERGRAGGGPDEPSLDAVRRTDSFVDALAGGRPVIPQDAADAELAALLGGWRDEMRWPPATGLIAEADAVAALNAGLAEKRPGAGRDRRAITQPRGSRRGLSAVGAAAAAVLCIGGFGAVVAGAGPGDALYGVRTMLFGTSKQVRDDQVGLAAKTELNQVQDLIAQGDWEQAQNKLVAVSTQVAAIGDEQQKQELLDQFNDLSAKVVERDPQATAPPGVVYTVPASSAALVPAAEPTSTPGSPSLTTSNPSETSAPTTSSTPTTAATSSTATTTPTSALPTTPTSASPSTPSPTATSTSVTGQSTSVTEQGQATPTATSAAPSTAAETPTTTAAPASAEQATPAEEPRAASTSAVPGPQTTVSQTVPDQAGNTQASPAETAVPQPEEPLPTAAVTTTAVPVPVG